MLQSCIASLPAVDTVSLTELPVAILDKLRKSQGCFRL